MKHKITTSVFLLLTSLLVWFGYGTSYFYLLLFFIITIYIAIVVYGSYQIRANYFLNAINSGNGPGIALTFDDGPDKNITLKIIEILSLADVPATFFVIGKKAAKHPSIIKEMSYRKYSIQNHSYSHSNGIGLFSKQKLGSDIDECSKTITQLAGTPPSYFRPPFGVTNPRYAPVLKKLGLAPVGWSIRSFDTTIRNEKKLYNRITANLKPGSIVLLHDTKEITLSILPKLINFCKNSNLPIVPLNELIQK
jgi:peptidoglycan/xylan/chitin deacetylase (PgdA/CDA1 family)